MNMGLVQNQMSQAPEIECREKVRPIQYFVALMMSHIITFKTVCSTAKCCISTTKGCISSTKGCPGGKVFPALCQALFTAISSVVLGSSIREYGTRAALASIQVETLHNRAFCYANMTFCRTTCFFCICYSVSTVKELDIALIFPLCTFSGNVHMFPLRCSGPYHSL